MKLHLGKTLPALAVIACLNAPLASAHEGFYAGLKGGKSYADTNEDIYDLDDDTNYQGFAGWKFVDWFGVEAAYTQLGEFDGIEYTAGGHNDVTINVDAVTVGASLWGSFGWGIDVYAKLGGYYATTERESRGAETYDENDVGVFYEAGLLLPINDMIGITLSWQNFYEMEILKAGTDIGVDMFDIGIVLNF